MRISSEPSNSTMPGLANASPLRTELPASSALSETLNAASQTKATGDDGELQKTFQDFVGQTFFGQMIASMRSTQDDVPYFNGGRAEKIFQGQLDQVLAEELSDASAAQFADPMFKLFQLSRSS